MAAYTRICMFQKKSTVLNVLHADCLLLELLVQNRIRKFHQHQSFNFCFGTALEQIEGQY